MLRRARPEEGIHMRGGPRRLAVRLVFGNPRVGTHAPAHRLAGFWANTPVRSASASSCAAAPFTRNPPCPVAVALGQPSGVARSSLAARNHPLQLVGHLGNGLALG